jgi:hypothetical protein
MAGVNGTIAWGITPYGQSTAYKNMMWWGRHQNPSSCNVPLIYQIIWTNGTMRELTEPSKDNYSGGNGDIVSVRFDIYTSTNWTFQTYSAFPSEWKLVGSINKERDLPNVSWDLGASNSDGLGHRFTVDVASIISNEMSYSLCPIGKGTWQSHILGGMNGGKVMQDNYALSANNPFVQDMNGAWKMVRVQAKAFIVNADGEIIEASTTKTENRVDVLNSVHQWDTPLHDERLHMEYSYNVMGWGTSRTYPRTFQDTCPNSSWGSSILPNYMKKTREDEHGEFLYWFIRDGNDITKYNPAYDSSDDVDLCTDWALQVVTTDSVGAGQKIGYLTDFTEHLDKTTVTGATGGAISSATVVYHRNQRRPLCQNVSLPYIINNATVNIDGSGGVVANIITATTTHYRICLMSNTVDDYENSDHAGYKWYSVDREKIGAMTSGRPQRNRNWTIFHWLNRGGGISSYTAKRNFSESVNTTRTTIERKDPNRIIWQDKTFSPGGVGDVYTQASFMSDSMRGGNYYKGGREVLGVEAQRSQAVFTDPLNKDEAHWLEEIATSPSVWIEVDTNDFSSEQASTGAWPGDGVYGKTPYRINPFLRPTNTRYMPVIITNSEVETVNTEKGLTQMNFTYTLSHKIETQNN